MADINTQTTTNPVYPDLGNKFPSAIDDFQPMIDPDPASSALINQYYSYMDVNDTTGATNFINQHPELKRMIFNAVQFNRLRDGVISIERYYLNDVQQYIVEFIKPRGNFNISQRYTKGDIVFFEQNGGIEAFMAVEIDIPIGTLPTNRQYFYPVTLRGEQGASGIGLAWRGVWLQTAQYYKDDCVVYDNIVWASKEDNQGQKPYEGSGYWDKVFQLHTQIIMSPSTPAIDEQQSGDFWFEELQ